MIEQQTPWIDGAGTPVSEDDLRRASKTWNASTWEDFLKSTVESPLLETLASPDAMDNFENQYLETHREMLNHSAYPYLAQAVRSLLRRLSKREHQVIHSIFWLGLGQHEVAERLKLRRSTVRNARDRALRKLGILFLEGMMSSTMAAEDGELGAVKPPRKKSDEVAS